MEVLANATGDQALWYGLALNSLGGNLSELEEPAAAMAALEESYSVLLGLFGEDHSRVHRIVERLAAVARRHGHPDAARWRSAFEAIGGSLDSSAE